MININGKQVETKAGETVLRAAERAGIHIPHLCAFEGAASPAASCRVCVVEVEGMPRLQTSCTLPVKDGMAVKTHTPRVLKARRNVVELLLASHPDDCLVCHRNGDCELAQIASDLGIREKRYAGIKKNHPLDLSSPSLVRDPNKCILCGRCVTVCHQIQGVGAIDFTGRGYETRIDPAYHPGLNVSGCIFCGQCLRACPTGALGEKDHVAAVIQALADPGTLVVAQVAPAIPATLMEKADSVSPLEMLEILAGSLRQIGFAAVFDTSFAADLTIMEEVSELVQRIQEKKPLPMFTSCSPGWIRYVELYYPELIPHLSTCKSPQQMTGALIKEFYPRKADLQGKRLFSVSIMPCTAKKFEAQDLGDIDAVLTTRETAELLRRFGMKLDPKGPRAPLDSPFAEATGAGRIFGGSGGVMEAAIRTAHKLLTGEELKDGLKVAETRGLDKLKVFSLPIGETTFQFAVVNGLGEAKTLIDPVRKGVSNLHFIEVMTCPGGCVGGGGQPYDTDTEAVKRRLRRIYEVDRGAKKRQSHENEGVQELYRAYLGKPLGPLSHRLLHRKYTDRKSAAAASRAAAAS
jgi:NADH-quinone oxidoreductase subunit G/NADP-reducing hydrogenase subunit HndD